MSSLSAIAAAEDKWVFDLVLTRPPPTTVDKRDFNDLGPWVQSFLSVIREAGTWNVLGTARFVYMMVCAYSGCTHLDLHKCTSTERLIITPDYAIYREIEILNLDLHRRCEILAFITLFFLLLPAVRNIHILPRLCSLAHFLFWRDDMTKLFTYTQNSSCSNFENVSQRYFTKFFAYSVILKSRIHYTDQHCNISRTETWQWMLMRTHSSWRAYHLLVSVCPAWLPPVSRVVLLPVPRARVICKLQLYIGNKYICARTEQRRTCKENGCKNWRMWMLAVRCFRAIKPSDFLLDEAATNGFFSSALLLWFLGMRTVAVFVLQFFLNRLSRTLSKKQWTQLRQLF